MFICFLLLGVNAMNMLLTSWSLKKFITFEDFQHLNVLIICVCFTYRFHVFDASEYVYYINKYILCFKLYSIIYHCIHFKRIQNKITYYNY